VAEVVHEVDVDEVAVGHRHGPRPGSHRGQQRDGEQGEVNHLLGKRMDHRCMQTRTEHELDVRMAKSQQRQVSGTVHVMGSVTMDAWWCEW
jgi:hypothetical protein